MTLLRVLANRVLALFGSRRRERDLSDEIQTHLDTLTDDFVQRGLPLGQARAAARREFGGVDQVKEAYRDQRGLPLLEIAARDLRHAIRSLRRAPAFTAVAVLTFALGVGAATAMFVIVNSVILRPLPYPNASRLVQITQKLPGKLEVSIQPVAALSSEQFRTLRMHGRTLSHVVVSNVTAMTLTGVDEPVRVNVGLVTPGFFEAFGIQPVMGRSFGTADEPSDGQGTVALLSHRTWTRRFARDPKIVGRTVTLNDRSYPIVGVMPQGFNLPESAAAAISRSDGGQLEDALDFWVPWAPAPATRNGFTLYPTLASMVEDVPMEQVAAEVRSLLPPLPDGVRPTRVDVIGLRDQMVQAVRPTLMVFQIAVVFVLLIACANVANLLLARSSHRRRELAIRLALGASRMQAMRESLTECVLLALGGSLLGSIIAMAAARFVRAFPPGMLPRMSEIRIDLVTLGFALALSVTAGAAVAVFVTIRILRADAWKGIGDGSIDFNRSRPSPVLVVVQVAAALVLLVGAGLLLTTFLRLTNQRLGFEPDHVLTLRITLPPARYPEARQQAAFYAQLVDSLSTIPGVEAVAAGTALPYRQTRISIYPITIAGRSAEKSPLTTTLVTPGYFRTLRVPLVRGREFFATDRAGAPLAVIVNQSFATRYFASSDPIGQEVQVANAPPAQIVGVVVDTTSGSLGRPEASTPPLPSVYFSATQLPAERSDFFVPSLTVVLRTAHDPLAIVPAVRRSLATLDSALPIYAVATLPQLLSERYAESRLYSTGAAALAATALFLAVIGLYGVMAYSVSSRTQEWGIRMALGADARLIVRYVMGFGVKLTLLGLVLGVAGALLASRSLQTLLFGVKPNDPMTMVAVAALFLMVAGIACYLPARRASRVDPMVALRHE